MRRAAKSATERGDRRLGNEHVLIGIACAEGGPAPGVFKVLGIDPDDLVREIDAALVAG